MHFPLLHLNLLSGQVWLRSAEKKYGNLEKWISILFNNLKIRYNWTHEMVNTDQMWQKNATHKWLDYPANKSSQFLIQISANLCELG